MFVALFAFGNVVLVWLQYEVCEYGVGLVRILGCVYVSETESLFYF